MLSSNARIAPAWGWIAFLVAFSVMPKQPVGSAEYREDVDIEWRRNDAGVDGMRASFLVKSTRDVVWTVLVDYVRFPEVFRNVRQAKVLRESADGAEVDFVVDAKIRDLHYILDRRYVELGRRIAWSKISGDLGRIEGGWTIEEGLRPGLLHMTYESYVEVEWYVPSALARFTASREVRAMVGALRARLASYEMAQTKAYVDRIGLWKDRNPMPPWDWRKTERER